MTKDPAEYRRIFDMALAAAKAAIDEEVARRPEGNDMDCGFAWVVVRPANHPFINWCKREIKRRDRRDARPYGDKNWNGGWCFWKPGDYPGQSIRFHEAGARAFRDVLAHELGISPEVGSRLD